MALKICDRCKKEFTCCSEKKGCWCESLSLNPIKLTQLKNRFTDCLCNLCLAHYADPVKTKTDRYK